MEDNAKSQLKRGGLDLLDPCFIGSGGPGRGLGTEEYQVSSATVQIRHKG